MLHLGSISPYSILTPSHPNLSYFILFLILSHPIQSSHSVLLHLLLHYPTSSTLPLLILTYNIYCTFSFFSPYLIILLHSLPYPSLLHPIYLLLAHLHSSLKPPCPTPHLIQSFIHFLTLFHFISFYTILPHHSPHPILHPLSRSVSLHLFLHYPTVYLIPHPILSFLHFLTVSVHRFLHYPTASLTPSHPSSSFSLCFTSSLSTLSYLIPHPMPSFILFLTLFHFISFFTILPHPSPHSILHRLWHSVSLHPLLHYPTSPQSSLHPLSHSVSLQLLLHYATSSLTPCHPSSSFSLCFTSSLCILSYLIPHPILHPLCHFVSVYLIYVELLAF